MGSGISGSEIMEVAGSFVVGSGAWLRTWICGNENMEGDLPGETTLCGAAERTPSRDAGKWFSLNITLCEM